MGRSFNTNSFVTGQQNVTTSGTPVQLTNLVIQPGILVIIKAKNGNTGTITIGNSSANALNTGTIFFALAAGQSVLIQLQNLNRIWIDSTVSGNGIEYLFEQ